MGKSCMSSILQTLSAQIQTHTNLLTEVMRTDPNLLIKLIGYSHLLD